MAWSDLTFTGCSVLTASQLTALQANFAALALGASGAPPLSPASLTWTGQASGAALNVAGVAAARQLAVGDVASAAYLVVSSLGQGAYSTPSVQTFNGTETVVGCFAIGTLGNEVRLDAAAAFLNEQAAGKAVVLGIRVGSLGGTVVSSFRGGPWDPNTRNFLSLFGYHTPNPGTTCYLLTAKNDTDATSQALQRLDFAGRETAGR